MHYHIDAWIWATEKLLEKNPDSEPFTTFLKNRVAEKAKGITFFGVTLGPKAGVPDELLVLLEDWTAIYNQGRIEGFNNAHGDIYIVNSDGDWASRLHGVYSTPERAIYAAIKVAHEGLDKLDDIRVRAFPFNKNSKPQFDQTSVPVIYSITKADADLAVAKVRVWALENNIDEYPVSEEPEHFRAFVEYVKVLDRKQDFE